MAQVIPIQGPPKKKKKGPLTATLPKDLDEEYLNAWTWTNGAPYFHLNKSQFVAEAIRRYILHLRNELNGGKPFTTRPKNHPGARRGAPSKTR